MRFGRVKKDGRPSADFAESFAVPLWRVLCANLSLSTTLAETLVEKHCDGYLVGGMFTLVIAAIAALDAFAAGGLVLLASAFAGLAAGICIGGLIAASFAMVANEETKKEVIAHSRRWDAPRRNRVLRNSRSTGHFGRAVPAGSEQLTPAARNYSPGEDCQPFGRLSRNRTGLISTTERDSSFRNIYPVHVIVNCDEQAHARTMIIADGYTEHLIPRSRRLTSIVF